MRKTDALLLAITLAVFGPAVLADFAYDDVLLVAQNELTASLTGVPALFFHGLWDGVPGDHGETGFYRPLMVASLAVDRAMFGLDAWGHHVHSLLWHLGGVALLLAWLRSLGVSALASLAGAAVFALHPAQVETVLFVSARNDSMAAAFLLGGLLTVSVVAPSRTRLALLAGLTLLGAFSKESAVLAPLFIAGVDIARRGRVRWAPVVASGLGLVVYAAFRVAADVGSAPLGDGFGLIPQAVAGLSKAALDPGLRVVGPHLGYTHIGWGWLVGGALITAGLAWRTDRLGRAGLIGAGLTLVPVLVVIGRAQLVADRYLSLAWVGVAVAVAGLVSRRDDRAARVGTAALVLVLAAMSARSVPVWSSDAALRLATVEARPNPHTLGSLAKTLEATGDLRGAAVAYAAATQPPNPYPHACFNVASIHLKQERPELAASEGLRALEAGCDPSAELVAAMSLGMALSGDWEQAEAYASRVGADPTGQAVLVRAAAAARRGDLDVLRAEADARGGDVAQLAEQVARVLDSAGYPESAARVRQQGVR